MPRTSFLRLYIFLLMAAGLTSWFIRPGEAADPCAIATFNNVSSITLEAPRALVVGDFNNDGKTDLAAANNRSFGTVVILLGAGTGTFSAPINVSGGRNPTSMAAGDLNADGKLDLVLGNETNTEGDLTLFLGNGNGTFASPSRIFIVSGQLNKISALALSDINSDGELDLVAVSSTFNTIYRLLGNGTGGFTFLPNLPTGGTTPSHLVMVDLNGDAKLDLIVTNQSSATIATLVGDGTGSFTPPVTFAVGEGPSWITSGDFNSDGKTDVAVANRFSDNISILLGDGAGNFGPNTNYSSAGSDPSSVLQSDFNGDGKQDLAVFNLVPNSALILQGDGLGSFAPASNFPYGPQQAAFLAIPPSIAPVTGDFNLDGRPDLAVVNEIQRAVSILLNTCGDAATKELKFYRPTFVAGENNGTTVIGVDRLGDINGAVGVSYSSTNATAVAPDDYTSVSGTLTFAAGEIFKTFSVPLIDDNVREQVELFNVDLTNPSGGAILGSPSTAPVFISDDDPTPTISISNATVAEGDLGLKDAVFLLTLSNPSSTTITVNYATANGSATAGPDYDAASGTITFNPGVVSTHLSILVHGDLLEEINETFVVNLSSPTGATLAAAQVTADILDDDATCPAPSFATASTVPVGSLPFAVSSADFNGDGKQDLAVPNFSSNNVTILLGNGAGGFAAPVHKAVGLGPRAIAAADLTGDGKIDLITANSTVSGDASGISVLLGDGAGNFASPLNTNPVTGPVSLAVGELNGDLNPDLAVVSSSGTVSVLFGNGTGAFSLSQTYAVGISPVEVALGDFNGDNKLDMSVANQNSQNVSVLLNNGNGTYATATNVSTGQNPQGVAPADFNGDGKLDIAVAHSTPKNIVILAGNGVGGFSVAGNLTLARSASTVRAADVNADGKIDLIATNADNQINPGLVSLFFGDGVGGFSSRTDYVTQNTPQSVVATDLNGDSRLDLAVANAGSNSVSILLNGCSALPVQSTFQFNAPTYNATESDVAATVTITRSGDTSTAASVEYLTLDGSASSLSDYTINLGKLTFASGETSKAINILLADDLLVEGTETLTLALSSPTGAVLGSLKTAQLNIADNDALPSNVNPLDDARFFVHQQYSDFLNRLPEPGGWDYWTNQITECGTNQACIHARRIGVSAAFFVEAEFQRTGYVVTRLHRAAFGSWPGTLTRPKLDFVDFSTDRSRLSDGPGLPQSTIDLGNEFVGRPIFLASYPLSQTNAQFVNKLFDTASLTPYTTERQQQIDAMNGGKTRSQVLLDVIEISEFKTREYNRSFVLMQYFGYLRRDPDQGGYDFWLNVVDNREPNNYRGMVCSFITSAEYQLRFGSVVTRHNSDCAQ